jgi:hypothetical protein
MEKFNLTEISPKCRPMEDVQSLANAIRRTVKSMSWGSRSWTLRQVAGVTMGLQFRVSGHHHKGLVILMVNGSDLFDIYLTKLNGEIKEKISNIYIEDLIDTIDKKVEYLNTYQNR